MRRCKDEVLFARLPKLKGGNPPCLELTCLEGFSGGGSAFLLFTSHSRFSIHSTLAWGRVSCPVTESSHESRLEMALHAIITAVGALLWKCSSLQRCFGDSPLNPKWWLRCRCTGKCVVIFPAPAAVWWPSTRVFPVLESTGNFAVKLTWLILGWVCLSWSNPCVCHPLLA